MAGRWIDANKLHYRRVYYENCKSEVVVSGKEIDALAIRTNISDIHDSAKTGASDFAFLLIDAIKAHGTFSSTDAIDMVLSALEDYERQLDNSEKNK